MSQRDTPRMIVTGAIFALLSFVLWHNVDNEMLIGALIGALGTATTFWLGSSKGSADKSEELSRRPQTVTIDQPPDDPVPVETSDGKA
jgi:hypothetical protein